VSIISLGDELVDIDRTPGQGQVYDVNSYSLAAAARDAGAEVNRVGIVPSDSRRLREIVEGRLLLSEIVVIAGGVGGEFAAEIRASLSELGDVDMARVAMHPGSVQGFGRLGPDAVPTFLLPSNPMSALVVFEVMVRPLIRAAQGKRNPHRRQISARLLADHVGQRAQGFPARPAAARREQRRVPRAAAGHVRLAPAGVARRGELPDPRRR